MKEHIRLHMWVCTSGEIKPSPSRASQSLMNLYLTRPVGARYAVGWVYDLQTFRVIDMFDMRELAEHPQWVQLGNHWDYETKDEAVMSAMMKL